MPYYVKLRQKTSAPGLPGPECGRLGPFESEKIALKQAKVLADHIVSPSTVQVTVEPGAQSNPGRRKRRLNPFRLTKTDKAAIAAFLRHQPGTGKHLETNGSSLDIKGMGGRGIAVWHGGQVQLPDTGKKSAETVHRYIRKHTPKFQLLNPDIGRPWRPTGALKPKHAGMLGGAGYLAKGETVRHRELRKAIELRGHTYRQVLGIIMSMERLSTLSARQKGRLKKDRQWLVDNYGGKGTFGPRAKK